MQEMIKQIIRDEITKTSKKYFFIAGLPRSGSTLLSAILNQNPRFYSGPNSPVISIMRQLEQIIINDEMFNAFPKLPQANLIVRSIINNWYRDIEKPVVFDKNTAWTAHIPYISGYLDQKPKIIFPVRNLDAILASFIEMFKRNPLVNSQGRYNIFDNILVKNNTAINDESRCFLISGFNGILGQAYNALKAVYENGQEDFIHIVEYDNLVSCPQETLSKIYDFLEEDYFEHKFNNIKHEFKERDEEVYGFLDMHEVRPIISKRIIDPKAVLPESIYNMCQNMEFWRYIEKDEEVNQSEVTDVGMVHTNENNTELIGA